MIDAQRKMAARGQVPFADQEPDFPYNESYLFTVFSDLHSARTNNGFGPNPISFVEIAAYERVMGVELNAWDIRMLRRMDTLFLTAWRLAQPKPEKKAPNVRGGRRG